MGKKPVERLINPHFMIPLLIGIFFSVFSIFWLFKNFNFTEMIESFQSVDYWFLIIVILLIILSYLFRSIRWGQLFSTDVVPTQSSLFSSLMIGYLGNNILPARTGELVRVYAFNQQTGISKSNTLATVLVERLLDLIIALMLLSISLLVYPFPQWLRDSGLIILIITLIALFFVIILKSRGNTIIEKILSVLKFLPDTWREKIRHSGNEFLIGLSNLKKSNKIFRFFGYSVLIWTIELGIMINMAWAFHFSLSFTGALFVILAIGFGTMIPSTPGFIGTYEFFTITALGLIGITGASALSFTIATHAITFITATLIGIICVFYTGATKILFFNVNQ